MGGSCGVYVDAPNPPDRLVRSARLSELDSITQHCLVNLASVETNRDQLTIGNIDNEVTPIHVG